MTLQIGRITGLDEPMNWQHAGDSITLTGSYQGASADAAAGMREQLLGYEMNPDEPVIPIVSTAESRLNGFYHPTAVTITTNPVMLARFWLIYTIQATRLSAFRSTTFESVVNGAIMVNDWAVLTATGEPFHGYPASAWEYNTSSTPAGYEARPSQTGAITWARMSPNYKFLARFGVIPSDFYNGACRIFESSRVLVGRRESPGGAAWTIDNGIVQLTQNSGYFTLNTWAGGVWNAPTAGADFIGSASGQLFAGGGANQGIRILRNAPEECIVRMPLSGGGITNTINVDVSLRRGSRIVRLYLVAAVADQWTFGHTVARAYTALTAGIRLTANDAAGNRLVFASAKNYTADLVNGKITGNAAQKTMDVGLASELGGSAAVNRDTAQSQIYQYLAAQSERMQVVAR